MGALRPTPRALCGTNGVPIGISGCSHCVVSFMGLQTEFPILVCDLSTDAIIGIDTLGSDGTQQRQLASILLQYSDLFPVPGSSLTGHTDVVGHEIDTADSTSIHCTPAGCHLRK